MTRGPLSFLNEMRIWNAFYTGVYFVASMLILKPYHRIVNGVQHEFIGQ